MKISANMIIGEFNEPYLKYALNSIRWVDEIVIVNTANFDFRNIEIKRNKFKFINYADYYKEFNFANARNLAKDNSTGDYILKIDADEVYYNSFEKTVRSLDFSKDIYELEFYHFLIDIFHYQYIESKEVLFKNNKLIKWQGEVHEQLVGLATRGKLHDKFCHLGYTKLQKEIFKKWIKYVKLDPKLPDDFYKGRKGDHILEDRIAKEFPYEYPEVMREFIKTTPSIIKVKNRMPKIGVIIANADQKILEKIKATADYPLVTTFTVNKAFNNSIKAFLADDDVRWLAFINFATDLSKPWASEFIDIFAKGGVGAIIDKRGIIAFPRDVFEKIGLLNEKGIDEFIERVKLENLKVEER